MKACSSASGRGGQPDTCLMFAQVLEHVIALLERPSGNGAGTHGDHVARLGHLVIDKWEDLTDEFGIRWSMPEDAPYYMDITLHPLAKANTADVKDYPWPRGDDPSRFAGLRERALTLRKETPYAVVSGISGVVYEICWYLRGLEQWFCDLMGDAAFCEVMLDQMLKFWLDWFRLFLDEVGMWWMSS